MTLDQADLVDFKCPRCKKDVSFSPDRIGSVQECPWCAASFVVPERSSEVAHEVQLSMRTPRLQLRRLQPSDQAGLLAIMSENESFRYLDWQTMNDAEVQEWLEQDAKILHVSQDVMFCFGVELLADQTLIAVVSLLYEGEATRQAGFNVVVNRDFRKQGYGTEATSGVLEFGFRELNLRRISVGCESRNIPGLKMLARAGMRQEGELIEAYRIREEWVNTVSFALLAREYKASPSAK